MSFECGIQKQLLLSASRKKLTKTRTQRLSNFIDDETHENVSSDQAMEKARQIMETYDTDNDGTIDWYEFMVRSTI